MGLQPAEELLFGATDADEARVVEVFRAQPALVYACAVGVAEAGRPPAPVLTRAVHGALPQVEAVPIAVVRDELTRLLLARDVQDGLQWLHDSGILGRILPELEATVDFSQESGRRHKDVWEHTKQVVRQSVPRPAVRWGALLHDIGKVPTRTFLPDGKVHFHGHAEVGARMFDPIARRFGFDKASRQKIRFLILHHLRANQYAGAWTDSAVRRFDREMGEHLTDLLDLSRADITSKRPGRRQDLLTQISGLATRITELRELDARLPPLPTGLGTDITTRFGIPPSRRIGDLKQALEDAIEKGELEERRESPYYLDWLAAQGLVS